MSEAFEDFREAAQKADKAGKKSFTLNRKKYKYVGRIGDKPGVGAKWKKVTRTRKKSKSRRTRRRKRR